MDTESYHIPNASVNINVVFATKYRRQEIEYIGRLSWGTVFLLYLGLRWIKHRKPPPDFFIY